MKIIDITHKIKNIKTGECINGGAVETGKNVKVGCGCGLPGCHCSDGFWLCINRGIDKNNKVKVTSVRFDNKKEFLDCLKYAQPELLEPLIKITDRYTELRESGDAGFWDEDETEKQARRAIAKATGK